MNFVEFPDREVMLLDLANKIAGELRAALEVEDRVSFCVPGGTTPGPVFDILSGVSLDWGRVDVLLNDERWVPESSERSNTALLKRRLLVGQALAARLIPLHRDVPTPEEGLPGLICGGGGPAAQCAFARHGDGYAHGQPVSRSRSA